MKQFLLVALVTAVGFVVGSYAGIYFERHRPIPGPPAPFMGEFGRPHPRGGPAHPINRAELIAQIEAIRPQLEQYRRDLLQIDDQFSADFDALLNDEQKARHAAEIKRRHDAESKDTGPLTDDRISFILREEPVHAILWEVVIPFHLDRLTAQYKLDDGQREKVRLLLRKRRQAFLELIDRAPPPSVGLSRLAPWVQRLAEPAPAK